jgi:hypothetical protein
LNEGILLGFANTLSYRLCRQVEALFFGNHEGWLVTDSRKIHTIVAVMTQLGKVVIHSGRWNQLVCLPQQHGHYQEPRLTGQRSSGTEESVRV